MKGFCLDVGGNNETVNQVWNVYTNNPMHPEDGAQRKQGDLSFKLQENLNENHKFSLILGDVSTSLTRNTFLFTDGPPMQ